MWQLQNFNAEEFLAEYWQQKPLLIRQAFPGFKSLLTPEELAGLACEEGVHCRLVIEKDGDTPWQLRYGPFSEDDFTHLPPSHYSLLVSECEKWLPELGDLFDCFDFVPRWRIDDLMISYAPEHGSVGPHIDEYDVFLIQANGTRRWSVENHARTNPEHITDLDLAILQTFSADRQWVLEPGDMLYLPPGIAHHGVAVGDGCMTYSLGFRSPSVGDVMDSLLLELSDRSYTDRRYYDPPLHTGRDPAEISMDDISRFRELVDQLLDHSQDLWPDIVGKMVSDTSQPNLPEQRQYQTLEQAGKWKWQKQLDTRLFYFAQHPDLKVFCNGQTYPLEFTDEHLELCKVLGNQSIIDTSQMGQPLGEDAAGMLLALINSQALVPMAEDDD